MKIISLLVKLCSACKIEKDILEFSKNSFRKDGYQQLCKACQKEYYENNKEHILCKTNKYKKEHRKEILDKEKLRYKKNRLNILKLRKQFPWKGVLKNIKQRCNNSNNPKYKNYGGRGIKCLITAKELKKLWFKNKAYNLNWPSIDRKDNDGHYKLINCRFIEMVKNTKNTNLKKEK